MALQACASNARMLLLAFLAGFAPAERAQLAQMLDDCSALRAQWRATADRAADLWIVNGSNACSPGGGLVEVREPAPLRFRPAEMPRPVAFTEPLHASV